MKTEQEKPQPETKDKPTIAELEALLDNPCSKIHVNPDGSISAKPQPEIEEARYLTDDRDSDRRNELVIFLGGNGDIYVAVVPEGTGCIGKSVRICTSGGASTRCPGLAPALMSAFNSIVKSPTKPQPETKDLPLAEVQGGVLALEEELDDTNSRLKVLESQLQAKELLPCLRLIIRGLDSYDARRLALIELEALQRK